MRFLDLKIKHTHSLSKILNLLKSGLVMYFREIGISYKLKANCTKIGHL